VLTPRNYASVPAFRMCAWVNLTASRCRKKQKTQDGHKLRCYKRRWKIERLFAWPGNFRRLVVRYERRAENYLGFMRLGCIVILLRYL
jgi:transposase